jgi:hypothetical protein
MRIVNSTFVRIVANIYLMVMSAEEEKVRFIVKTADMNIISAVLDVMM